jgi:hypothetical protein
LTCGNGGNRRHFFEQAPANDPARLVIVPLSILFLPRPFLEFASLSLKGFVWLDMRLRRVLVNAGASFGAAEVRSLIRFAAIVGENAARAFALSVAANLRAPRPFALGAAQISEGASEFA